VFLFSLIVSLQVTLPSGLQYKVLEEGPGMDHPKVHTPPLMYMIGSQNIVLDRNNDTYFVISP
jgi:hypothetical protein